MPALAVPLVKPVGLALDNSGALYISDAARETVWLYDPATRQARKIAGGGAIPKAQPACAEQSNASGDGCLATQVHLNLPYRVALDSSGNVYVPEHGGDAPYTIRILKPVSYDSRAQVK